MPQEEAEEYARLSPEEQQRRLRAIVRKIDSDGDGLLSKGNGGRHQGLRARSRAGTRVGVRRAGALAESWVGPDALGEGKDPRSQ